MRIEIDGFRELAAWGDSRATRRALSKAINATTRATAKEGTAAIRQKYNVKVSLINKLRYIGRATVRKLQGVVWYGGARLDSNRFPVSRPSVNRSWVKIRRGRRKYYPDAFTYERYKQRFLWQRSPRARSRNPRYRQGLVDPVRALRLSIARMALKSIRRITQKQAEEFDKNVRREFERIGTAR